MMNSVLLFQTIKIQDLIYKSYRSFGQNVSSEHIEHLRLKHRLRVVRQLEDSLERNTLRALQQDRLLDATELQVLSDPVILSWQILCKDCIVF